MKISSWWLLLAISIGIVGTYLFIRHIYTPTQTVSKIKRKNYDIIIAKLPRTVDMDISGPEYWKVYNFLDQNIPCSICRSKAIPLGTFRHDFVNAMLKKPIYDKSNWKFFVNKINEIDKSV